jgi:hypothetical protein
MVWIFLFWSIHMFRLFRRNLLHTIAWKTSRLEFSFAVKKVTSLPAHYSKSTNILLDPRDRDWTRLGRSAMILRAHAHCKPSRAEPSRAEPDRTELNRAERLTIHIASRADPNWKKCSWHFWTARMSNQVHVFQLMDNIWWRSLLFSRKRRFWVHNISCRPAVSASFIIY